MLRSSSDSVMIRLIDLLVRGVLLAGAVAGHHAEEGRAHGGVQGGRGAAARAGTRSAS